MPPEQQALDSNNAINKEGINNHQVSKAAEVIRQGGLVIFPTETFYGIAVDVFNKEALERLLVLKGRSKQKPFPLIASGIPMVEKIAYLPEILRTAASHFWPGPLTLALPLMRRHSVSSLSLPTAVVSAPIELASATVAVRVPASFYARQLVDFVGGVITATSANFSGQPPAQTISEIDPKLISLADYVLDDGETRGGLPSTILALSPKDPKKVIVYRMGAVSQNELESYFEESIPSAVLHRVGEKG